jgi:molybdopterin converting factor small subunit
MRTDRVAAIEVDVLMFGPLVDLAAAEKVRVSVPEGTRVEGLLDRVGDRFPGLRPRLASVAVAVNLAYVARSSPLRAGDEVALIPPVSGG